MNKGSDKIKPYGYNEKHFANQFNRIYRKHICGLTNYARRFVPADVAEDMVHDVFLKMWSRKKFIMPENEIRYFLYVCVLNACRNHLKSFSRKTGRTADDTLSLKLAEIDFLEAALDKTDDEQILGKIYEHIDRLPPKRREIFRLSYLNQKKSAEIAEQLNISRRTVDAHLYKALKFLRESLLPVLIALSPFLFHAR